MEIKLYILTLFSCHPRHKSVLVRNIYNYRYTPHVVCMCIYIYRYISIYIYIYIYIYTYTCMCVYVSVYVCMYIYVCIYFVHLQYIIDLKADTLIYCELGKHVCIFLHSFIFWQIDTYYWLTLGTFKRNSDIS